MKKGDSTRAAILKTARELFSEKGFSAVTMQDFCDRHKMSRGGLYRHFASTKEIFAAMLEADKDKSLEELEGAIARGISARQLFAYFIHAQKQEILQEGGRLSISIYDFCASNPDQKNYLTSRFEAAAAIMEVLIRYGQGRKEFRDGDAKQMAAHIVIFLEGLKVSSDVISLSEVEIDSRLRFLSEMVVIPVGD